jgi:hypothetical protein
MITGNNYEGSVHGLSEVLFWNFLGKAETP